MINKTFMPLAAIAASVCAFAQGAVTVPTSSLSGWQILSFNRIPANDVTADEAGLHLGIDGSASPLVFALPEAQRVSRVRVKARWSGELALPDGAVQGEKSADDFVLKIGLVEAGDRRLNWVQKKIAAKWVRQLFRLAPPDTGIRRIHFLSTTQQRNLVGDARIHPLSDLLAETRVHALTAPGAFEFDVALETPAEVLALWISSDGDDTGSRFDLTIEAIELL